MLPTVLRRCPWCYSYLVWLCGFHFGVFHVESCLALCSRVVVVLLLFFQSFFSIVISSLAEETAGLWSFSCILCLLCTRLICPFSRPFLCQRLPEPCDYSTPGTFLLTFFVIIFNMFEHRTFRKCMTFGIISVFKYAMCPQSNLE